MMLSFTVTTAYSQESKKTDKFNENHGVFLDRVDTSLKKFIKVVRLEHSTGIIFPAQYGKEKFGYPDRFTPDGDLIKKIDRETVEQYPAALRHLNDQYVRDLIERDDDKEWQKRLKKSKTTYDKQIAKSGPIWAQRLLYYDKQYWGFITAEGRKTVCINAIDLREDPYSLREKSRFVWIEGWHGWFETNVATMYYHLDNNSVTINFD